MRHIPTSQRLEQVPLSAIKENPRNTRLHPAKQVDKMVRAFGEFGFIGAVLLDAQNNLISGHLRVAAARIAGMKSVPAIRVEHLSPDKLRAFAIADNKLATLAEWDLKLLAEDFAILLEADLDFDVTITGFEAPEIDVLLHGDDFASPDPADELQPVPPSGAPITQLGDQWEIGPHRLACLNSRLATSVASVLGAERAQIVVADGPFNVPIDGHVSGKGRVRHREFVEGVGELSEEQFAEFNREWLVNAASHCKDGALIYAFMDGRHLRELLEGAQRASLALVTLCVWAKSNAGMGSLYRSQIEHVGVFKCGRGAHTNNIQLGRYGRNRSNLWSYPGMNSFGRGRDAALSIHPTVKPVGLLADIILDASQRGDVVLDPFAGSSSTLIAAHRTGRRGYGIELDPLYVDASLDRLSAVTRIDPVRVSDGALWSSLRTRSPEDQP